MLFNFSHMLLSLLDVKNRKLNKENNNYEHNSGQSQQDEYGWVLRPQKEELLRWWMMSIAFLSWHSGISVWLKLWHNLFATHETNDNRFIIFKKKKEMSLLPKPLRRKFYHKFIASWISKAEWKRQRQNEKGKGRKKGTAALFQFPKKYSFNRPNITMFFSRIVENLSSIPISNSFLCGPGHSTGTEPIILAGDSSLIWFHPWCFLSPECRQGGP